MNRFKCPACGGDQYTAADTAEGCIYCGHKELKKMETLEPEESEGDNFRFCNGMEGLECYKRTPYSE